ncbi:MAG: leucine-rich repeat protein [Oscillospiraceae bacterium]
MKKILAGLMAFSMLCGLVYADNGAISRITNAVSVSAETLENGLTYEVNEDSTGIIITDCDENAAEIEIPPEIDGLPVISIGDEAFFNCKSLTKITIPDSVTDIGKDAFYYCESLTEITIPDSITSIGSNAFGGTPFLGNQTTDVKYAGKCVIDCVYDVPDIEIKPDTICIADYAFYGCQSLTAVTIPDSVISIGDGAFADCEALTEVTIGKSVKSIGISAFSGCELLTSVTIPDSVISLGGWAFENCTSLTEVIISDYVTDIGVEAFYNCISLKEITIPKSVTNIDKFAFLDCTSLTEVTIPKSVTSIGEMAFHGCTSLTEVTIPESVESIGAWAFGYYKNEDGSLTKIENFTIYGVKGSAAENYAIENEFNFVEIESEPAEKTGDIDGDGETTSSDALNVLQAVVGEVDLTDEQKKLADLNGDGQITSADALGVLQIVVGIV